MEPRDLQNMALPIELSKFCNITSKPSRACLFIHKKCYPNHRPTRRINIKMEKRIEIHFINSKNNICNFILTLFFFYTICFITYLLRYNSYSTKCTLLMCIIQQFLVDSQGFANFTTNFRIFSSFSKQPLYLLAGIPHSHLPIYLRLTLVTTSQSIFCFYKLPTLDFILIESYLNFYDCHLSLSVLFSRFIHVAAHFHMISFYQLIISHYMDIPNFVYLLISWWTFRLFLLLGYYK